MKMPAFIEKLVQRLKLNDNHKPLSTQEKWLLLLLSGVLLAVIIFPAGKSNTGAVSGGNSTESVGNSLFGTQSGGENQSNAEEYLIGNGTMTLNQYEIYLSRKLEEIIAQIDGAGKVDAWVTLKSSSEKVLYEERDIDTTSLEEADSVGGTRNETANSTDKTVIKDSGGNPYVVKTMQPQVEGVLVVAEGAGDSTIKKNISEAVEVLFGIDAHRIKVAKKKVEE